jgi:hypothetical protein
MSSSLGLCLRLYDVFGSKSSSLYHRLYVCSLGLIVLHGIPVAAGGVVQHLVEVGEDSGNIQGTFREHSGNIQGSLSGHLNIPGTYGPASARSGTPPPAACALPSVTQMSHQWSLKLQQCYKNVT